jgi:hypothetical protein
MSYSDTVPEVWVPAEEPHVPAHRITRDFPAEWESEGRIAFHIACPPLMAFGGHAITRARAAELKVFPCLKCWGIRPADIPTTPPPLPPGGLL